MKKILLVIQLLVSITLFSQSTSYHAIDGLTIIGRPFPTQTIYNRFPDSLEQYLRKPVWKLSRNSAGIAICFESNSKQITAKWKTAGEASFQHVAGTLVKGLDFYAMDAGKWYFVGTGRPSNENKNEYQIIKDMNGEMRQYILYLPCYDNTDSVMIGVDSTATFSAPTKPVLSNRKPIVFYGTSIMQGASAMRPGMAHAAIIERRMQTETINLGFSGNGQLDSMMAVIMSAIDASCYVIDCGPNLTPQMAQERTLPFLRQLKRLRPAVPVLLVENMEYPTARFSIAIAQKVEGINLHFKNAYKTLLKEGYKDMYYLPSKGLIGDDGEATVDGAHMTDLGFYRMANAVEKVLRKILP
jgi:hypothetical protein